MIKQAISLVLFSLSIGIGAQDLERKIEFPDIDGFLSLKCDFHIHTVFSDGLVWPTIRIDEAVKDGLDAIALTEHIEYQPWKDDIKHEDRNRSYQIASKAAKPHDLIVIHGTEITRDLPPGHANALLVTDVNEIMHEDLLQSYRNARAQGAFIFWNHPNWNAQQKDAIPVISDIHQQLISEDLLHGIEVVNDMTFSEEALQLSIDHNLTVMGTSDIHGLVDYQYDLANGGHRPICLVFAKERSAESIKEALFAGRTVTWFENILAGKEEHLRALIIAALDFEVKGYIGDSEVLQLEVQNHSDARFLMRNISPYDFYANTDIIEVQPKSKLTLQLLSTRADKTQVPLQFEILNAIKAYKSPLKIDVSLLEN